MSVTSGAAGSHVLVRYRVAGTSNYTREALIPIARQPSHSHTVGNLTAGTRYEFRIDAVTVDNNNPESFLGDTTASASTTGGAVSRSSAPVKLIYRSDRTDIAESGPTDFWFPVRGRDCGTDEEPADPSRCGWLSLPDDLREQMNNTWNPVSELATDVYTALDPSPDSVPSGGPSGAVKVQLWAVFPHPERGMNSVSLVKGPYDTPFIVCWPSPSSNRVLQRYDTSERSWITLDPVINQHEGHICAEAHDLGYLGTAPAP